jgi:hypothetical protein
MSDLATDANPEALSFEVSQCMKDAPLTHHSETGLPVRRVNGSLSSVSQILDFVLHGGANEDAEGVGAAGDFEQAAGGEFFH